MLLETAANIYQPLTLKHIVKRLNFIILARRNDALIKAFSKRLGKIGVPVRKEMLGTLVWPYIHNNWDIETKFDSIATHYEILSPSFPSIISICDSQGIRVCDFSHISPNVTIEMDYAKWFTREGEVTINVFQSDLRVASMAFTLAKIGDDIVAYIGAIQGIHGGVSAKQSLEIYKQLTKDFSGLRPRSMLLEVLKVVVVKLGGKKIFGVSEQNRHHRHKYFGNDQNTKFKNDYNVFWEEHGASLVDDTGFYDVPMELAIRDVSQIAAKKRAQYRRRNAFVKSINNQLNLN